MTVLDAPDPEEVPRLLNPRRSAHATIRGYLYQTCLGVLRWLDLKPNEILLCEGDEDLDRFLLGGEAVSEQVKAYTGGLSLSDRTVVESLGNFLRSYVALHRRGETRRFVFTTTAHEKRKRMGGLNFDLLDAWEKGSRKPVVLDAVRSLLEPRKGDKNHEETTEAIAWLDAEPEGWKGFMSAVEWSFDAPDLDAIRTQVKNRLSKRADTTDLPAETFLERLVAHVLRISSKPKPEDRMLDSKALSDLIETARTDLGNWVRTPAAERLRIVFDELKQVQRLLHDNTRSLPQKASPGKLLSAAYEVIPFDEAGRREELDFLTGWCDSGDRRSVLLLTGEGGSGKTRLMIEWCRQLRHLGWHAGFFRPDRKAEDLDPLLEGVAPRFIVIDYAETRLSVVEPLLLKMGLQAEGEGPKLRLVLLARRKADWWENLSRIGQQVEDLLWRSPEPRAITPLLPKDTAERESAFRTAAAGFSFQLGLKRPTDLPIPDLSRSEFERVLYLHMAALAALQGERIETADGLLKQTLAHERQFWYDNGAIFGSQRTLVSNAFESVVAAVTLIGGISTLDALSLVPRILKDSPVSPSNAFLMPVTLITLYAGPRDEKENRTVVEPLQPDLLGEELVAEALSRDEGLLGRVLDGAKPEEAYSTLTVLTRLARRRPEFEKWLGTALHGRLEALAEIAVEVAVAAGDPLGIKLAEEMETLESIEVINRIQELCDNESYQHQRSLPLREVARIATEKRLEMIRDLKGDLDEGRESEHARLALNLGVRLSDLGRREDALNATLEAVDICRQLALRRPNVFLSNLAASLNNLGSSLSHLGLCEDALNATLEAVDIYRQLALQRPDALLPDLAASLITLGKILNELGQREDALNATLEAVDIYRQLALRKPEAFLPSLATSLNNLGSDLSSLGRREDALKITQEAVEIRRQLARQRPDAFLPDLATSLHNLGGDLGDLGLHEDALNVTLEAVKIYRQLVLRRPDAFLSDLALSLMNLGSIFNKLDRREDALKITLEAVKIYRQLALRSPDALLPNLALSLNNLGNIFNKLGRREEALNAAQEAVEIYRQFTRPDAFLPDLADGLNNLGATLSTLGRHEEALNIIQEAVNFRRQLALQEPVAFLPDLAMSLNNLGVMLSNLGRQEEAFGLYKEAVQILEPFFLRLPLAFQDLMGSMVSNYIRGADATDRSLNATLINSIAETFNSIQKTQSEE
jgi:tetratricopeptide (TPR) repeat protein